MKFFTTTLLILFSLSCFAQIQVVQKGEIKTIEPTKKRVIIYPNPVAVNEFTTIEVIGQDFTKFDYKITDWQGNTTNELHTTAKRIRLNFNQSGIYFGEFKIKVQGRTETFYRKIFVR